MDNINDTIDELTGQAPLKYYDPLFRIFFNPRIRFFKNGKGSLYIKKRTIGKMMLLDLDQPGAYISHLSISPKWRNKGLGGKFMKAACLHASFSGCTAISLHCAVSNVGAIRFYKGIGFFIAVTNTNGDWQDMGREAHYLLTKQLS